ncbi:MAG: N-acetylneuraminate synthase family protein [Actinomycetales bacterium]|nr:N-acetylneuraminate synthase family protein [Actinomycetales bacterium]
MIIEKRIDPYIVFAEDPLEVGLRKISANKERIVFCVDEHGMLLGSLSDGDFRRWVVENPASPLGAACLEVANKHAQSAPAGLSTRELAGFFSADITHLPLVDERGHFVALAVNRSNVLKIEEHLIGEGHPTFLIAEIGNNHNGSVQLAKQLVDLAADAGADAVKFQLRDMAALYRNDDKLGAGEDLGVQYVLDLLNKFALPAEELFPVFDYARQRGVAVMCTPWDLPSVQALVDYGIDGLKIASADLTNHELLQAAGSVGLPLILSTGMSRESEILQTTALLQDLGTPFALLHCQSTYPAPYKDINLAYLTRLAEIGGCPVGYSGHERGWHIPIAAVAQGASIVEKHFTIDQKMEGNDHRVSLLPDEFAMMVQQIRDVETAIGDSHPRAVSTGEMMNRINLAKSLVAAKPIRLGQVIREEDVAVKSPGRGLQPNLLPQLLGLTAHREMNVGDFFFDGDLQGEVPKGRAFHFTRPWGLPVRYHDFEKLTQDSNADFLEFHFSYRDLEIDVASVFTQPLERGFTTHLPDLFSGDFLVDLASFDDEVWERSIVEVQRSIDTTRSLKKWFPREEAPILVVSMGGYTQNRHVDVETRPAMYDRIALALTRLDSEGVRIAAQTLPPYPWFMGGQRFANLFLDPVETAAFAQATGTKLCLDISHTKLAANHLGLSLSDCVELLAPHTIHLHLVDATGIDGEGVQVGDGEVDWPLLCRQLNELAPGVSFIPEIWQGHVNSGEGFWTALNRLEAWL